MLKILINLLVILFIFPKYNNTNYDKINISDIIFSHLSDSHQWHLFGEKHDIFHLSFKLPIILWDKNQFIFFNSNLFDDNNVVMKKYRYYRMINEVIYRTNSKGQIFFDTNNCITNYKPLDFSITKNVIFIIITSIIIIIFCKIASYYNNNYISYYKLGFLFEYIVIFIRDFIIIPNFGYDKYKKFLPFFLTVFFYILFNNLLGLTPFGFNLTGNFNITFCLSFFILIFFIIYSNINFWNHIFFSKNLPIVTKFFIIPVELLGIFIKPLTLCIRLFSNMIAGHIISIIFIILIIIFKNLSSMFFSIFFSIFIYLLEIFVSFLQAFIFTYLSAIFVSSAVNK